MPTGGRVLGRLCDGTAVEEPTANAMVLPATLRGHGGAPFVAGVMGPRSRAARSLRTICSGM
jgi:hypothetical protein